MMRSEKHCSQLAIKPGKQPTMFEILRLPRRDLLGALSNNRMQAPPRTIFGLALIAYSKLEPAFRLHTLQPFASDYTSRLVGAFLAVMGTQDPGAFNFPAILAYVFHGTF
ncbi:hypothetical protein BOTBODRAFT_170233 [Botryobasidium botryosum FD-172 SS1]|uniref:Uncharacterized protein n=1 Tax=Botryobasidium botryosum (strain FD-172 SS1) TaxID=930990 RepID=A0A067MZW1_BOTB1|nr:hypothetical protein BOTBODRAFT_170233 [Botryobasidium botryosum FD-172 SS1]